MTAPPLPRHITVRCQFCEGWNRVDGARVADRPKCAKCARPILIDRPYPLTDESFRRTVETSELPVLVDFYADWCGPCKMMAPAIDALAQKVQGRALVAKLNTDLAQQTAQAFQIRSIPTVIVFEGGREVRRESGAVAPGALERLLKL
ncbi:MAG: thioredoxin TrxC [Gemmatimonadaceae bacterium]